MSVNMHKKYTESLVREWPVPEGTQAGTLVIHPISNQVGVTITARGDSKVTVPLPQVGLDLTGYPNGGVGNKANSATVAVDGSWRFPVAGTVNGDTNPATGTAGTPAGTAVYRHNTTGNLSLTAASGTKVGVIDDAVIVGNVAPVLIGAVL